jgi:hypothetical protein
VHRGRFAELGTIADALEASAQRRGALVELSWALNNRAESLLYTSDDVPRVVDQCTRSLELLQGTDRWSAIAIAESVLAVAESRAGRVMAAREAAQRALAVIRRMQPTSFGQLVAYAGTAAAFLACWDAKGADADAALRADAGVACRELRRLARNFPIARPASRRHDGLRQWLLGRRAKAERLWRRAIQHAEAVDMPYEVGAAHLELGRHLAGTPAVQHLERAAAIFGELQSEHDRRRALSALDTAPRGAGSLARPRVGW